LVIWSGQGSDFFDDIWAYDSGTNAWRKLPSSGAVPEARYGSCASLGPDGRLWVSHGFTRDDGRFADTRAYEFASGRWTDETPSGSGPVERCLHDCFWSSDGQRLILYGGQTTGVAALGDIWAYDVATSSWQAGAEPPAAARQLYALAVLDDGAVIFGGGSADGGFLADGWTIDEPTLDLRPLTADGPPERSAAAMITDPATQNVLLFGGENGSGLLNDMWQLSPV
jgi:hypothetical protein